MRNCTSALIETSVALLLSLSSALSAPLVVFFLCVSVALFASAFRASSRRLYRLLLLLIDGFIPLMLDQHSKIPGVIQSN